MANTIVELAEVGGVWEVGGVRARRRRWVGCVWEASLLIGFYTSSLKVLLERGRPLGGRLSGEQIVELFLQCITSLLQLFVRWGRHLSRTCRSSRECWIRGRTRRGGYILGVLVENTTDSGGSRSQDSTGASDKIDTGKTTGLKVVEEGTLNVVVGCG